MRKIIALLLMLVLWAPNGARAQVALTLSQVQVELWPEFDRPSILVIYHLTLPAGAALPVELRLRIPAVAGAPNAVASRQPDGSLINLPYDQSKAESSDWSQLIFRTTSPEVQIEFYDPTLGKEGAARHFEYRWPGDYAVEAFSMKVQEPLGATEMRISPSLGAGSRAEDGMVYYMQDIGALTLGQTLMISVDYQKSNDALSAESVPIEPSGPLTEGAIGHLTVSFLPWALGLVGLLLIVGGGYWYWRSGRGTDEPKQHKRGKRRPAVGQSEVVGGEVYCHQCGKRAAAGDRFCRACGAQLRLG